MEKLVEAVQQLSLARDVATVQEIVRHAARALTKADGATFVLRDGNQCFYADEDAIAPLWKGRRFPMEICISGWVMQHRQPVLIKDIYADRRIPADAYRPTFVKSLVMVPIRTLDPIGAIGNYWARHHQPTPQELKMLQALADSTAVQLESIEILTNLEEHVHRRTQDLQAANARIRELSLVDDMTGLHNRRGFLLLAEQERSSAARLAREAFVLFIDADGLKSVNDSYGHEAGDQMLCALAKVLKATFRSSDVIGRLSGDEFCVFGIHEGQHATQVKARVEESIASFNAQHAGPWRLAASIGLFSFPAEQNCALEEAMANADKAMYLDKIERRTKTALETTGEVRQAMA